MMLNRFDSQYLSDHLQCSEQDKLETLPVAWTLLNLAQCARTKGIASFTLEGQGSEDPFFQRALLLVVNAIDPELIEEILCAALLADGCKGKLFLQRIMTMAAFLSIQQCESPAIVAERIRAYYGADFSEIFQRELESYCEWSGCVIMTMQGVVQGGCGQ